MNDTDALDLASLLCSRLCHDMLSPVGALSNGLELLSSENDPEMRQRCFELLEQSARISTDKLKFFRLAYGAAGGFGEYVDVAEPKALIEALAGDARRITIHWAIEEAKLPKPAIKVLLNLSQIGLDALVRGGTLDIGVELRDGAYEIVVRATGSRIAFDKTVGEALLGDTSMADLSSRTAPAHMIALVADSVGGGLQYQLSDEALLLGAVIPAREGLIG
jgi:histidine phosphotransferase ChpT